MKHVLLSFALVLGGLIVSPAYAGPGEDGIALYNQKNYADAVPKLQAAADIGHAEAQYYLAYMYNVGRGVRQSDETAFLWYNRAAEGGNDAAMVDVGYFHEIGKGTTKNTDEAVQWYRKAADLGQVQAQYNLGNAYYNGLSVTKSFEQAAYWYQKAADNGHAGAASSLGMLHENGYGVETSMAKAVAFYRQGAEGGDVYGMTNLGNAYYKGLGTAVSYDIARTWFQKAADDGFPRAQYFLGELYEHGRSVPQSKNEALIWYKKAAAQGWDGAQAKVDALETLVSASVASSAQPTTKVSSLSSDPKERACEQGDASACSTVLKRQAKAIINGNSDEKIVRSLIFWAQFGCEKGAGINCFTIGDAYGDGAYGLKKDVAAAAYYHDRACSLGEKSGCGRLKRLPAGIQARKPADIIDPREPSALTRTPDGKNLLIPESVARHMRSDLVRMGRNGNQWKAQDEARDGCYRYHSTTGTYCFTAAWMSEHGYGTSVDLKQARSRYSKACDQGSNAGCGRFAKMSYKGEGGEPDYYSGSSVAARLCKSGEAIGCYNYHRGAVDSVSVASPARIEASANFFLHHCEKAEPYAPACYNLGILMESRYGYDRRDEALRLYGRSCSMKNGLIQACKAKSEIESVIANEKWSQQQAWDRQNEKRGLGGFLSDLGRGINQATSTPGALSRSQIQGPHPTRAQSLAASPEISRQDWINFDNAINAINNTGTAFNSNCPASNPNC